MAKVGLENDTLKQPKCPSNWEYSTGQRQLLDIQSGEQMDRLSFSAQNQVSEKSEPFLFLCFLPERVRFVREHYPSVEVVAPEDCIATVRQKCERGGADVVLEIAGAEDTFRLAWECARPNAIVPRFCA